MFRRACQTLGARTPCAASGVAAVCHPCTDHGSLVMAATRAAFGDCSTTTSALIARPHDVRHDGAEFLGIAVFAIDRNGGDAVFCAHLDRCFQRTLVG